MDPVDHCSESVESNTGTDTANGDVATAAALGPRFDFENLRISQGFATETGVKKLLTTIPVRKPSRQEFVRVHPHPCYRLGTYVFELTDDRETYVVAKPLWTELAGELVYKMLYTTITRQGVVLMWPVRLPGADGRIDSWNQSAAEAAEVAMQKWVRLASNRSLGAYEIFEAGAGLSEPSWPEENFNALLAIAFKGRIIQSLDHPVIKRLRGLI